MLLAWLLVESVIDMSDPENSYTGQAWLGVGRRSSSASRVLVAGIVLMLIWRRRTRSSGGSGPVSPTRTSWPDQGSSRDLRPGLRRVARRRRVRWRSPSTWQRSTREPLVLVYGVAPPGGVGEEFRAHQDALEELGRAATSHALEQANAAGVRAEVELVHAKPAAALLDVADRRDARMIVVGSYGESALRGVLLGSTTYRVLNQSSRPVLVVRS